MKRFNWLAEVINRKKFGIGAEIGVMTGRTTGYLLANCPSLKQIIAVDSWIVGPGYPCSKRSKKLFNRTIKQHSNRVKVLEGNSWNMAQFVEDGSLDFVFIDASHDYASVTKDIAAWVPKVRIGGLISGHDYGSLDFPGVKQAVDDAFETVKTERDKVWFVWKT